MEKIVVTVTERASDIINRTTGHKPNITWHAGKRRCPFQREQAPAIIEALEAAIIEADATRTRLREEALAANNRYNARAAENTPIPGYQAAIQKIKAKLEA